MSDCEGVKGELFAIDQRCALVNIRDMRDIATPERHVITHTVSNAFCDYETNPGISSCCRSIQPAHLSC